MPILSSYNAPGLDEMFDRGTLQPSYECVERYIRDLDAEGYSKLQNQADIETLNNGITFTVYANKAGTERIFPFSLVPRIMEAEEWRKLSAGLKQRIKALNLFLNDIYHDARCVNDGVIPADLTLGGRGFMSQVKGINPPLGCYVQVAGLDLIRADDGEFRVLEDNLRTPSGVSYVIENRRTMRSMVPSMFPDDGVELVDDYADNLLEALIAVRPAGISEEEARVVILTPGHFNSAYFEHSFLSRQMGIDLVEGPDLIVQDDKVYMRSTSGLDRVHVVYRRIDDDFLDPKVFRKDSMLGVPGIMKAYQKGNVTIANAPGTGIADDKATYHYVPDLIRYYLSEEPIIQNIPSYLGRVKEDLDYMLEHLAELVSKPVDGSGGYGVFVGPQGSPSDIKDQRSRIRSNPDRWMAQPLQNFSTIPTFNGQIFEARRSDLRAFIVTGKESWVLPGGLTRVAQDTRSYIVNSSQGGGSKDTWVLRDRNRNGA